MIDEAVLVPVGAAKPEGAMHDLYVYSELSGPAPLNPTVLTLKLYSSPTVRLATVHLRT